MSDRDFPLSAITARLRVRHHSVWHNPSSFRSKKLDRMTEGRGYITVRKNFRSQIRDGTRNFRLLRDVSEQRARATPEGLHETASMGCPSLGSSFLKLFIVDFMPLKSKILRVLSLLPESSREPV